MIPKEQEPGVDGLLRHWEHLARTPKELLENYAARNNLTAQDVQHICYIIEYAERLVIKRIASGS